MRMIRYYVINKNTNKAVYTDCRESKCREFIKTLGEQENYAIEYKWMSI